MSLLLQLFDDMVGLLDPELQPTSSKAEVVCVRTHVCMCWLVHVCVCACVLYSCWVRLQYYVVEYLLLH